MGRLKKAACHECKRNGFRKDPQGRSKEEVAVSNRREAKEEVDEEPTDGKLSNREDHHGGRMAPQMIFESSDPWPTAKDKTLTAPTDEEKQSIISRQRGRLGPQKTVPETEGQAANGAEEKPRHTRCHQSENESHPDNGAHPSQGEKPTFDALHITKGVSKRGEVDQP